VIFSEPGLAKIFEGRYNSGMDTASPLTPAPTLASTPPTSAPTTTLSPPTAKSKARFKRAERKQIEWRPLALDQLLPPDHRARVVWRYVESLDLEPLYAKFKAVEGAAGRDGTDPKILMALWMFATIEGVGKAREVGRLCERDLAYMWICGGVGVNYHMLSDFRVDHGEYLDELFTDTIATLLHQELITLETVAQDGMRVRASAGSSSFRREPTLEKCLEESAEQVKRLREEQQRDSSEDSQYTRREAAQHRAAVEREQRIQQALAELPELREQKEQRKKGTGAEARVSTTDPEARKMKMADGGYRPAYNVQFASDGNTRLIVGVDVTNEGNDHGLMAPMYQSICERYGKTPKNYLVDCGFNTKDDITTVEQRGTQVFAPIHGAAKMLEKGNDPHARQRDDSDEMVAFRKRMATDDAKTLYKTRPSIAEFPNAVCRNHGLTQFRVRGTLKTKAVAIWHALTHNLQRMMTLGWVT
jgi:transposase